MNYPLAMSRFVLLPTLLAVLVPWSAGEAAPRSKVALAKKKGAVTKPVSKTSILNTPLVKVSDPNEGAFSISLPKGWRNQAYLVRLYDQHRSVVTSLSPDEKTVLFFGDPRMPRFSLPSPLVEIYGDVLLNPLTKVSPYVPAPQFFQGYVWEKFGALPGFRIVGSAPDPRLAEPVLKTARERGLNPRTDTVRIAFNYQEKGQMMRAIVNGYTCSLDITWFADVSGISTAGDPMAYNELLHRIGKTFKTDPQWQAGEQQLHEQRMAMLRQDHANQIASWNASNRAHQMRMNAIQDAGNASMKSWYEKQAASDSSHRRFLNSITSENTVVTGSGQSFQVDNSHQQYFVNKRNNSYIGTDGTTSLDDLRAMGVNPDDYEVAKIKR